MEILVKEERDNQCIYKEQNSVEVAMPVRLSLILSELYHQPVTNHYCNYMCFNIFPIVMTYTSAAVGQQSSECPVKT